MVHESRMSLHTTDRAAIRLVHIGGICLGAFVSVLLWACAPRVEPGTVLALDRVKTTALDTRTQELTRDRDHAALEAATETAAAAVAAANGRDAEARAHRDAAAFARARESALADALARNEAAASKARADIQTATDAADERAATAAARESAAWDRRACWWVGALCSGAGVALGLFARSIGMSAIPGAAIGAGGLTVAAYGQTSALLLPLVAVLAVAGAIIALRQRHALQAVGTGATDAPAHVQAVVARVLGLTHR
jgi:hypothetical protein